MLGQPPVIWDRAEGFQVYDPYGNKWLDWSSGVLVTNIGHGDKRIKQEILNETNRSLLFSYCFPAEARIRLAERLVELSPDKLNKAFILTTGSEATENAIKLTRTYGQKSGGVKKITIVSFELGFHGRTLGAQMAGGYPQAKKWIGNLDPDFIQVPFPDGYRCSDTRFNLFEDCLSKKGVDGDRVAGVIMETFQGGGASFAPKKYVEDLRLWCDQNNALLIFDEVQAGFGRTGKLFAFEHYNVVPDIICLGKGISGSLPLSAVLGPKDIMNLFEPGSMTSTHGGNPICCAAALANIEALLSEKLVENAHKVGSFLSLELQKIQNYFPEVIGTVHGKGLVFGLHIVKPNSKEPDGDFAFEIVKACYEKGLLMFAPVGFGGATIKICPPLMITSDAVKEGLEVLQDSINEVMTSKF
jgi:4-aminobutyrate aminotransferase-like enzyme